MSCQWVRLGTQTSRAETYDQVELRQKFRPMSLMMSENLRGTEVFKVFVICHNVNQSQRSFKVVLPHLESCKYCQKFLIMGVIVDFSGGKWTGMENYRVNVTWLHLYWKDGIQSIVRGICFHNDRPIRNPMSQNWSGGKSPLQGLKWFLSFISEIPRNILVSEMSQRNDNVGVVRDEPLVEISKTQKRLCEGPKDASKLQDDMGAVLDH